MIKRNIVANFLGQGWRALMSFAFVPLYVRYLGVEAFGLIGFYTMLHAWMGMLDVGLRPALSREMARYTGGVMTGDEVRDVLRTAEIALSGVALAVGLGVALASGPLARDWINAERLPFETVRLAVALMGLVMAVRFVEGLYQSCLGGLQRQVAENAVSIFTSTGRSLGAVLVLAFVSPTIEAFFIWQSLVSVLGALAMGLVTYRHLGLASRTARPSLAILRANWRFASGMMFIALVSLLASQLDKIILSRSVSLGEFGYYALAVTLAGMIVTIAAPVGSAFAPRLTQLVVAGRESELASNYHLAAQLVCVLSSTIAAMLTFFGSPLITLWTGDPLLAEKVAPLLRLLACGAFILSTLSMPYFLQLAYGWTALAVRINLAAILLVFPALLLIVPRYGAIGAAWVWLGLNIFYFGTTASLTHRRLLVGAARRWYVEDFTKPAAAAALVAVACSLAFPYGGSRTVLFGALTIVGALVLIGAMAGAALVRSAVLDQLRAHHLF